jgi:hypothetical protein
VLACTGFFAGCELKDPAVQVIPGPTVPSPVALYAPYVWDTRQELTTWTDNAVSRGSFWIDEADSNGAIAVQLAGSAFPAHDVVLRGPDLDPPVKAVRTIRIRYQWMPASGSGSLSLRATFEPVHLNTSGYQPIANGFLKAGTDWKETEFGSILELSGKAPGTPATPDVRYLYFTNSSDSAGVLKIDAITLVQ